MARLSKAASAAKKRENVRDRRPRIPGVYLRTVTETTETYNITVGERSKRLNVPVTLGNAAFLDEVQKVQESLRPKAEGLPFSFYVDEYIKNHKLRPQTAENFRRYLAGYGFDNAENRRRACDLRDGSLAISTKRVRIKAVRAFFTHTSKLYPDLKLTDPTVGMDTPDGKPRSRIPTQDEIAMLLYKTDAERYVLDSLFVRLILDTGARCSTILCVRPCDLDEQNRLSLFNVKMGRKYEYPQLIEDPDTLRYWREATVARDPSKPLFDESCQKRLQARMNRWFGRDADGCTLSPHSLRHLKATTLARKGCPIKLAALLLDASPTVLMKTYQNFSQDDIDSACRDYKNDYKQEE